MTKIIQHINFQYLICIVNKKIYFKQKSNVKLTK